MIEKILERLESSYHVNFNFHIRTDYRKIIDQIYDEVFKIVQEVSKEYGNGWIPCSERLPEEQDEYLVTWIPEYFPKKRFCEIVEYSPEDGWIGKIPQAPFGKYTIIAWQALAPYQKGE